MGKRVHITITQQDGLWAVTKGTRRLAYNSAKDKPRWASKVTIDDEIVFTLPRIHELFEYMSLCDFDGFMYDAS